MNILILVNPAKNYKSFFFNLSRALKEQGHTTYFAYDSKKSTITTPIPEIDNSSQSFYFDEYLKIIAQTLKASFTFFFNKI